MKQLLMEKKAVLFDLDGTLVDSMWMWKDIDIKYLARFGKPFSPTLQKEIEGMSFTETACYFRDVLGIPQEIEEIKADWIRMSLHKYANEVTLKPHAGEFLRFLSEQGFRAAIASSNSKEMVDACLKALGITGYFQAVCTACEVEHGKPSPDIYLYAAEKLGVAPGDCIVFEDVPAGIRAGKAAGMPVIAVEDAFSSSVEEEKRRLSDGFIRDYIELL